jgi:hypothetical protein
MWIGKRKLRKLEKDVADMKLWIAQKEPRTNVQSAQMTEQFMERVSEEAATKLGD